MIRSRLVDLCAGLRTLPGATGWLRASFELAWAAPMMLIVAYFGALISLPVSLAGSASLGLAATVFVVPALGEELLFRGLVMPRDRPGAAWIALSALLFVLWHPLQAVTIGPPWAAAFLDPWFLACTAILGVALARIYVATRSLWPCVVAHWLIVLGWKALLGGPF